MGGRRRERNVSCGKCLALSSDMIIVRQCYRLQQYAQCYNSGNKSPWSPVHVTGDLINNLMFLKKRALRDRISRPLSSD